MLSDLPQPPPAAPAAAVSQQDAAAPPVDLSEVVVRPARLPPSVADAAFSIVTISPEALAAHPRLDEALETAPGASLFRRATSLGANPTTQGISLRAIAGSGASRALVTLDGVPQNDPFGGWVIWTGLPSEEIAAAKLVRGAGSGPYGAGALTGVVSLQSIDSVPGGVAGDVSYGSFDDWRGAITAGTRVGDTQLTAIAGGESTDGYKAVRGPKAGRADIPLDLHSETGAASATTDFGPIASTVRLSGYEEKRSAGLVGTTSNAKGGQASVTLAEQPTSNQLGWKAQAYVSASDLQNSSVSTSADRNTTTPANNQYTTPTVGWGLNGALRGGSVDRSFEVGADLRGADGQSEETFRVINGAYTRTRFAGGADLVGGLYGEAQQKEGPWLFAEGLRADGWSTYRAHRTERDIASGATTLDLRPKDRSGVVPTGRFGVRRDLEDAFGAGLAGAYLRAAAYAGFRPPTLNELHRPFRVGNDITEANPGLKPERLYGGEFGGGLGAKRLGLDGDVFYNVLDDAIANVTQGVGPFTDPIAGVIPAGGTLRKRMNAGAVDAYGLEIDGHWRPFDRIEFVSGAAYTHSRVDGGTQAPQLTGLRPALTPRLTATGGVRWTPQSPFLAARLTLSGEIRYESLRYDDDQNIRPLAPATTADLRAEWRLTNRVSLAVAIDNIADIDVQTARAADGTLSYAAPRTARLELRIGG